MAATTILPYVPAIVFGGLAIGAAGIFGWIHTTRMRIKHGYPLDGMWGQALHPKHDPEAVERVKLLTQENAQLRAEIGSVKDRLANVERIVTDSSYSVSNEIESLRDQRGSDAGVPLTQRKTEGHA